MPLPKPKSLIPKDQCEIQIKRYRYEKWGLLSGSINKDETKCIWYSKDQIRELWEEMAYQETIESKKVTGVRVYLATFPNNHLEYPDQINLVFVLTKLDEDGNNADFFIEEQTGYQSRPDPTVSGINLDHGIPCPPDCDDGQHWP